MSSSDMNAGTSAAGLLGEPSAAATDAAPGPAPALSSTTGKVTAESKAAAVAAEATAQAKNLSYFSLYRYSDRLDLSVVALGVVMSVAHGVLTPLFAVIFGQFIDAFTNPSSLVAEINRVAVNFLILGAASFVSTFFQAWCFSFAGKRQADRIRRRYFQAVLRQDIGWYDLNDSAQMTSRVASDALLIQEALSEQVGTFLQYSSTCVAGFLVGFAYGWKLTLVILALVPPLAVGGVILGRLTSRLSAQVQAAHGAAGGAAEEVISCIRTVIAFGGEQTEIDRYAQLLQSAQAAVTRKSHFHGVGLGGVFFAAFSAFGLAFWYGSVLVRQGDATAGDVLVVFFSIVVGAVSIGSAAPPMQAFLAGTGAAAHIFTMIERVPAIDASSLAGERLPAGYDPTLRLEAVDFHYPSRPDVPISRSLSLTFPAGKTVALVGFSGSGKSTVVSLLERFYDPVAGKVTLGGHDVRTLNVRWLRAQMALVSQEPILFNTTIAENIGYGADEEVTPTQAEIEDAARQANAHDFIMRLPLQYGTVVGERGVQVRVRH
jgi:ATP-binding cassette, subfamily B (MDR/TAP), member 1